MQMPMKMMKKMKKMKMIQNVLEGRKGQNPYLVWSSPSWVIRQDCQYGQREDQSLMGSICPIWKIQRRRRDGKR